MSGLGPTLSVVRSSSENRGSSLYSVQYSAFFFKYTSISANTSILSNLKQLTIHWTLPRLRTLIASSIEKSPIHGVDQASDSMRPIQSSPIRHALQLGRLSPSRTPFLNTRTMATATSAEWSAAQYLKFEDKRTQPARDLLARVPLQAPKTIVDLGCGPGNSTAVLVARYSQPSAHVRGIDSSPDMIEKARATLPEVDFELQDLTTYVPPEPVDLFFSNAVLQWLGNEERMAVMERFMRTQPSGGVFAFQVPDTLGQPSHMLMREIAASGPWAQTLKDAGRDALQTPQEIYDRLKVSSAGLCSEVEIFRTEYYHSLENHEAIIEWVKGTGLKPYIDPLSSHDREAFLGEYLKELQRAYPRSGDGRVLLRYPRLFVVAVRR